VKEPKTEKNVGKSEEPWSPDLAWDHLAVEESKITVTHESGGKRQVLYSVTSTAKCKLAREVSHWKVTPQDMFCM